ncbi:MAG: ethanolamine ammonia-lyase reactivating factor EutA [Oscillospiraceae bacterium]|nr:ethanolamine ammonia-lyase reactivating factor EutA [Oscillospiraceae bacterium]
MSSILCSVGVDVGTTTTQLVVSQITAENKASSFAVPEMEITGREILYKSPIHFTPLLSGELVDGEKIRAIVDEEYAKAGIRREDVDTGAIIITGETSRKENAGTVLAAISDFAGDFVVATAGPDLESVLAAKGAGAVDASEHTEKPVLHMDIGGGTSNLALIGDGKILRTGCLNVGGRLMKFDDTGCITYISPVLQGLVSYRTGERITENQAMEVAVMLAQVLEMAAGLRQTGEILSRLTTQEAQTIEVAGEVIPSFSGGVADCIAQDFSWLEFGDLGPLLGRAIRRSRLCQGQYRLGSETIRATVIGAGCHSAQLSGSTVYYRNVELPLKNLQVATIALQEQDLPGDKLAHIIAQRLKSLEQWGVLALPGWNAPSYGQVTALADAITRAVQDQPCCIVLEEDMAKALGHALALRLPESTPCLCIDRVRLPQNSYLDVGAPVGPAISVVVKTLILSH